MNRRRPRSRGRAASSRRCSSGPSVSAHAVAAMARHRRARPVGRQLELVGQHRRARSRPVRQLAGDRAVRIVLAAEHLVLPQRVVGVLHRQRRQAGAPPAAARRVERRRARGPAAPSDQPSPAMWCSTSSSTCSPLAEREQRRPQQRTRRRGRRPCRCRGGERRAPARASAPPVVTASARPRRAMRRGSAAAARRAPSGKMVRSALVAARPGRPARLPAPPVERAREPQAPAGCCRSRCRPSSGRGTTAGAARTTAAIARRARDARRSAGRAASPARRRRSASAATVGASNSAADGELDTERGADPADQPRRQQRMAAEREEVVVGADPLQRRAPRANSPHRISSCGVRGARGSRRARRAVRRRQRLAVELAVRASAAARPARTNADGTM